MSIYITINMDKKREEQKAQELIQLIGKKTIVNNNINVAPSNTRIQQSGSKLTALTNVSDDIKKIGEAMSKYTIETPNKTINDIQGWVQGLETKNKSIKQNLDVIKIKKALNAKIGDSSIKQFNGGKSKNKRSTKKKLHKRN
jgi:hypothetical protein